MVISQDSPGVPVDGLKDNIWEWELKLLAVAPESLDALNDLPLLLLALFQKVYQIWNFGATAGDDN